MRSDLAAQFTSTMIELMQRTGTNWRQSWVGSGLHRNAITKRPYRGVNQPITALSGHGPFHATYKQWNDAGAQVCKGQKGTQIFFFKPYAIRDRKTDEEKQIMLARSYTVFGVDQVENAPPLQIEKRPEIERHAECERIIRETEIIIRYGGDKAAYIPSQDYIILPNPEQFENREALYSVSFHEIGHATGHEKRVGRNLTGRFGDPQYSFEELIAEATAGLVCCATGIAVEPRKESAAYMNGWLRGMKEDKNAIVRAFSMAQRAADWILKEPTRQDISAEPVQPQP